MNTVEEYFDHVRRLVQNLPEAQAERHEEHILTATRGNLRIRLRFADNALLKLRHCPASLVGANLVFALLCAASLRAITRIAPTGVYQSSVVRFRLACAKPTLTSACWATLRFCPTYLSDFCA